MLILLLSYLLLSRQKIKEISVSCLCSQKVFQIIKDIFLGSNKQPRVIIIPPFEVAGCYTNFNHLFVILLSLKCLENPERQLEDKQANFCLLVTKRGCPLRIG